MAELSERTGRRYDLVTYSGAPDAERVILIMGSGTGAVQETVETLTAAGEKVGMVQVRLFQPFPAEELVAALPRTVRSIAVLDRCKEPGAVGEPFYLEAVAAINEAMDGETPPFAATPRVIGGRYGLSSKEFTPSMVKPIFDELAAARPKRHFTVGIYDDVTQPQPAHRPRLRAAAPAGRGAGHVLRPRLGRHRRCQQGLGEDHRRGHGPLQPGPLRVRLQEVGRGHRLAPALRPAPIRSTYEIEAGRLRGLPPVRPAGQDARARSGPAGAPRSCSTPRMPPDEVWEHLPGRVQRQIVEKDIDLYVIDAFAVAAEVGMGNRINTVMQPCFFKLSGVLPEAEAIAAIKGFVQKAYGKRGETVVQRNYAAIDLSLERLHRWRPARSRDDVSVAALVPDHAPDFVKQVTARIMAGEGDLLPVSAMPVDGTFPTATTQWEKRAIAQQHPHLGAVASASTAASAPSSARTPRSA